MTELNKDSELFINSEQSIGDKIVPKEAPSKNIGIDVDNEFLSNVAEAGLVGKLDTSAIESFTNISRNRDNIYDLLDMMMADSTMAAVLETFVEDSTEYNDSGRIVWAECEDAEALKSIELLIDTINIDKHIYAWAYSLVKYGDVYLKLFRQSDETAAEFKSPTREILNESIVAKAHDINDHYTGYVEMIKNPAEVFELTKLGKTRGFIKTNISQFSNSAQDINTMGNYFQVYRFNENDVELYAADDFVHGFLEDNSSRTEEKVNIFYSMDDDNIKDGYGSNKYNSSTSNSGYNFSVRRGQSLFYNAFKAWRELSLIKNSILLNRITKSAIVRTIQVNVGDMPKEMVGPHLQGIKQMIEQKSAITAAKSIAEYTNPGPIENNIYVPVHGDQGAITIGQIGGDVDMGQLTDLDSFTNTLFGALMVPKQYFGLTDDAAGFSGGQSLSLISSRYAKAIKRIQNSLIQMITDLINLMLIDRGFDSYVNTFTIKMQVPTTQEEIDRRENEASKVNMVNDIMSLVEPIEDQVKKLEILKSLLANVISDTSVIQLIQDEIDEMTAGEEEEVVTDSDDDFEFGGGSFDEEDVFSEPTGGGSSLPSPEDISMPEDNMTLGGGNTEAPEESFNDNDGEVLVEETNDSLPSPEQLGIDMTV